MGGRYEPIEYGDDKVLNKFKKSRADMHFVDAFLRQIKELFFIDNKEFIGQKKDRVYRSEAFRRYVKTKGQDYTYFYYPWQNTLVKCIREVDYFRLKTNRNQDLITSEEQRKLYNYKVAVFGMSVGSNIAFTITQSGISKNIVIADFDELDTSNLNRMQAGLHQVGLNKAIIAARRIYEDNPYAKVRVLAKGITKSLLEKLLKKKEVDCIVEEIDNMAMKIEIRRLAAKYKIPVLMITDNGDWAVLTIERYDLGYKKIFERKPAYWRRKVELCKTPKDFADIVINDIIGSPEDVSPRMMESVKKVFEKKFVSWPQLGSAALLGSVATTIAIKQIVRNEDRRLFRKEHLRLLEN